MYGPIAIFPKTVLSWRVPSPAEITPQSLELFFVLQPKLDILIVGVGEKRNVDPVRARIAAAISNRRIGYEILPTVSSSTIPLTVLNDGWGSGRCNGFLQLP